MSGNYQHVSPQNPCPICQKPDWCATTTFPNGNMLAYCQRVHGTKGETLTASGKTWRCKEMRDSGYTVWEPLEQYEAAREEFLRQKYPDYKGKKGYSKSKAPARKAETVPSKPVEVKGVSSLADAARLHEVYSSLLSLLVLEDKHEAKLRAEWDSTPGLFEKIIKTYPIKSLPPEDRQRYASDEKKVLKNLSRKAIMSKLIEKVGEPLGVPGFYMRKDGVWTIHPLCGILFPVFNTDGQIIRLRIGVDYPQVKGSFNGVEGIFSYFLKDEQVGWWFRNATTGMYTLVWQYGSPDNKITLNKKGYPEGKVNGKYMNFTSQKLLDEKDKNGIIVCRTNKFDKGCESGSFCSVYTKKGDDPTFVYITEGEKKAIVANMILGVPVISVPGVNALSKVFENEPNREKSMMDAMREKGSKAVVLVYDADKSVNEKVLFEEQRAVSLFKERKIRIAIGEWNPEWGKGLDDVLLTGVKPQIYLV